MLLEDCLRYARRRLEGLRGTCVDGKHATGFASRDLNGMQDDSNDKHWELTPGRSKQSYRTTR